MTRAELLEASALMTRFAERTGLTSDRPPQRYLWTDAFAVCNFLALAHATGDPQPTELALRLVNQVHHVLGRHREDDARTGWLSRLGEAEGEAHPTRGGLRIGKPLPERQAGEPFDERLEWDRDGQYFHYLTRWMHALDQVSRATGDPGFNRWARELAAVAHAAFTVTGEPGGPRMVWKLSIDLSRPLVPSMGQHDPLDGLVTAVQLEAGAARPSLAPAMRDFAAMLASGDLWTSDPLGLGGLLADAGRVAQLGPQAAWPADLLEQLLAAALDGLSAVDARGEWQRPASRRLAFRELGLVIGLAALAQVEPVPASPGVRRCLDGLASYRPLGETLTRFWLAPTSRETRAWTEHRDINDVMLATALVPAGYLVLAPGPA